MMQRITGAVAIRVQLHRDVVTDRGSQHQTTQAILRRTFIVERHCGDAHRSMLYLDVVRANPATLGEKLAWDATREAWQLLLRVFSNAKESLNADWVCDNVGFSVLLALESVYVLLKETEGIVDLRAPDVPDAA